MADPQKLDPTKVNLYYGTGAHGGTSAQGGEQGLDNQLPPEDGQEKDPNLGSEESDEQGAPEPGSIPEVIIETEDESDPELVETSIPEESAVGVPDTPGEEFVESEVETPPVETVLDTLGESGESEGGDRRPIQKMNVTTPGTDYGGVTSAKQGGRDKLESVSIYKTLDLISEGPIAGFCDAQGKLIPLSVNKTLNEDGFKGFYLNDVPVKNSYAGTLNYQRVAAEIKYGTADQTVMSQMSIQLMSSLSFANSAQTFSYEKVLAGFNHTNAMAFLGGSGSPVIFIDTGDTHLGVTGGVDGYSSSGVAYSIDKWDDVDGMMTGDTAQYSFINSSANSPSTYAVSDNQAGLVMIPRFLEVFRAHPVVFHHMVTNDNVTKVELNLFVQQLYLREMTPEDKRAKEGPLNNTIMFAVRVGYEDSDLLITQGGGILFYALCPISGLATSTYARAYEFRLPPAKLGRDRTVSVCVVSEEPSPDMVAVGGIQRVGGIANLTEIVEAPLNYPHSAIVGSIIDARSFSRVPKRTFDMKMKKVRVPENYDPENRIYTGNWTGRFSLNPRWTDNPAWAFYDMVSSRRYGLAKYGFGEGIVDKWNLYSIAKYCDELVETGYQSEYIYRPFSINSEGAVITIQDSLQSPIGAYELRNLFPLGQTVSLYKLKNSKGEEIQKGFRRRIGNREYDKENHVFKFSIHKVIEPGYIMEFYKDTGEAYFQYKDKTRKEKKTPLSFMKWIYVHLKDELYKPVGERDQFSKDYAPGFSLGNGVTEGRVVLDRNLYRPVLEPRFATNIYLDKEQDAFNCLNDLAAIFRGMLYWHNGFVFLSNDQARDAVMVFTNANVKDGAFTYSGSSKTTRFTSVLIRYNDSADSYKPKVEYVEDAASIRKYGYLEKKIAGLGITSRSQAYRLGKWFLFTNQLETDLVQFKTGIDATILRPGDTIKLQDSLKTSKRYGGRLKGVDPAKYQLTLDQGVYENIVGEKITLVVPRATQTVRGLSQKAASQLRNKDVTGITEAEVDETRSPQIKQFTISAIGASEDNGGAQNDLITVEADEAFSEVKVGTIWSAQNTAANFKIKEVEYRVISIGEETPGEYMVTALLYAASKFRAIDESRNLIATQQSATGVSDTIGVQVPFEGDYGVGVTLDPLEGSIAGPTTGPQLVDTDIVFNVNPSDPTSQVVSSLTLDLTSTVEILQSFIDAMHAEDSVGYSLGNFYLRVYRTGGHLVGNVWLGVLTLQYASKSYEVDPNKVSPQIGPDPRNPNVFVPAGTQVLSKIQVALTSPQELVTLSYQIDFEVYKFVESINLWAPWGTKIVSTTNVTDLLPVTGSD